MNSEYTEEEKKIRELLEKIENQKGDISTTLEIWKNIMNLDVYGNYTDMYSNVFENLINTVDPGSSEFIEIWTSSNEQLQVSHQDVLRKVMDFVRFNPDRALDVWERTFYNGQDSMNSDTFILKDVLQQALKIENQDQKLKILQRLYGNTARVVHSVDTELTIEALEVFVKEDPWMAVYTYNFTLGQQRENIKEAMDISLLNESIKKYIDKEKNAFVLGSLYTEMSKSGIFESNIEQFKKDIEQKLRENPKETLLDFAEYYYKDSQPFNCVIIECLSHMKKSGEDITSFKHSFDVSAKELTELVQRIGAENIPKEIEITVDANNISEIPIEILDKISNSIKEIRMERREYSCDEIKDCRYAIDRLLEGIDLGDENDPDREKKIFNQVIRKIAKHVKYDYASMRKEDKDERLREKLRRHRYSERKKKKIEDKLTTLNVDNNRWIPRNMVGGLLYGKSVCSGYADIVKNVFSCVGIESRIIGGVDKKGERTCLESNKVRWCLV